MGDPKRIRKKYSTPRQPFEKNRIDHDMQLVGKYGLRNMKSVWKHSTMLRNFRGNARQLLSLPSDERKIGEQELVGRLQRMGLLKKNATLDDVLELSVEDFLERRLQTLVFRKGMATTPHHARQMIVHGHISIGGQILDSPSYFVTPDEEKVLNFSNDSPFSKSTHKALPANVYKSKKPEEDKRIDRKRPTGKPKKKPVKTAKKIDLDEEELEEEEVEIISLDEGEEVVTEKVAEKVPSKLKDEL
ncbi:MAG: 30S ribosomal protein S4 [Asgard group archaeon]|nr:30S ribosomal protein S4 [Asgard group archaeon]